MIQPITPATSPLALRILTRAFHDDPEVVFLVRHPARRDKLIATLFGMILRHGMRKGEAYLLDDKAAAVWFLPGDGGMSIIDGLRPALVRLIGQTGVQWIPRVIGLMFRLDGNRRRMVQRPHLYLVLLGVEPEFQGHGLGAQLLAPLLDRADREGLPIYLETFTERAVRFYERHGFRIMAEAPLPMNGPPTWYLLREPNQP